MIRRVVVIVVGVLVVIGLALTLSGSPVLTNTVVDQSKTIHDFGTNI